MFRNDKEDVRKHAQEILGCVSIPWVFTESRRGKFAKLTVAISDMTGFGIAPGFWIKNHPD
jgi:hypothetical protein